jgi:hypothetical protein
MTQGSIWSVAGQNTARPVMNSRALHGFGSLHVGSGRSAANRFNAAHPPAATSAISPLASIAPGPTRITGSSAGMNWQGFALERQNLRT